MLLCGMLFGYAARKTGLLKERWGRPLHTINVVVLQANICWLTLWAVEWRWDLVRLPITGLALSLTLTAVGYGAGRLHGLSRRDLGTFTLACGMSNLGSTGGMLVCRVVLGDEALRLGLVFLLYWTFFTFLICFPLAKHFGSDTRIALRRLLTSSVTDIRLLPLVGMMVGLVLGALAPGRPAVLEGVVYVMVLGSGFLAMFAIGVTLHLRQIRHYVGVYVSQGAIKFAVGPVCALGLIALFGFDLGSRTARVIVIMSCMSQAFYSVMIANLFGLNVHKANSMFLVNTLAFLVIVFPLLSVVL
jgi:predicted permease